MTQPFRLSLLRVDVDRLEDAPRAYRVLCVARCQTHPSKVPAKSGACRVAAAKPGTGGTASKGKGKRAPKSPEIVESDSEG